MTKRLEQLGFEVTVRDGGHYRTDNGNIVLDARYPGGIAHPALTEVMLASVPGIVENGLFTGLTERVLLGQADGTVVELGSG